jgi:hypothetical protein
MKERGSALDNVALAIFKVNPFLSEDRFCFRNNGGPFLMERSDAFVPLALPVCEQTITRENP